MYVWMTQSFYEKCISNPAFFKICLPLHVTHTRLCRGVWLSALHTSSMAVFAAAGCSSPVVWCPHWCGSTGCADWLCRFLSLPTLQRAVRSPGWSGCNWSFSRWSWRNMQKQSLVTRLMVVRRDLQIWFNKWVSTLGELQDFTADLFRCFVRPLCSLTFSTLLYLQCWPQRDQSMLTCCYSKTLNSSLQGR